MKIILLTNLQVHSHAVRDVWAEGFAEPAAYVSVDTETDKASQLELVLAHLNQFASSRRYGEMYFDKAIQQEEETFTKVRFYTEKSCEVVATFRPVKILGDIQQLEKDNNHES
ncbi:hypothetical protein [Vibrio phage YC]|uniref:Uncharacterized protein n=1 Tax=Vibrio phage YC TaxID=2267403 RepID=A0A384ZS17_9CAUD|nr:hypothetical protein HWB64_gp059 [Vibrio phage YC]AXC34428.1 hypothetical protein [Vibrio phage YC]